MNKQHKNRDYVDKNKCIFCGESANTREHVPPRIFLDNLKDVSVVYSCSKCNESYSLDESYVAASIDLLKQHKSNGTYKLREKISSLAYNQSALGKRIKKELDGIDLLIPESIDYKRIERVFIKITRCHLFDACNLVINDEDIGKLHIVYFFDCYASKKQKESFYNDTFDDETSFSISDNVLVTNYMAVSSDGRIVTPFIEIEKENYLYKLYQTSNGYVVKIIFDNFLFWKCFIENIILNH